MSSQDYVQDSEQVLTFILKLLVTMVVGAHESWCERWSLVINGLGCPVWCQPETFETGGFIALSICFVIRKKKDVIKHALGTKDGGSLFSCSQLDSMMIFKGELLEAFPCGYFKRCNCLPHYERHSIHLFYGLLFLFFLLSHITSLKRIIFECLLKNFL